MTTIRLFRYTIGKTGFEPATPWSQTKYSTKLSYFPLYASGRIRTYSRLIRSQVLYPVEPRLRFSQTTILVYQVSHKLSRINSLDMNFLE